MQMHLRLIAVFPSKRFFKVMLTHYRPPLPANLMGKNKIKSVFENNLTAIPNHWSDPSKMQNVSSMWRIFVYIYTYMWRIFVNTWHTTVILAEN